MDMMKRFLNEEEGMGTVEVVMLILVLIGLAITFRDAIKGVINNVVGKVEGEMLK